MNFDLDFDFDGSGKSPLTAFIRTPAEHWSTPSEFTALKVSQPAQSIQELRVDFS